MPTIIAVDAMGTDRAPKPEVEGAVLAVRNLEVEVVLVGPPEQIRAELRHHPSVPRERIHIAPATEVIGMHEKAAQAVRAKRDSSMRVGLRLVRDGKAEGFITAGNTGAAMATAKMVLGALPGVDRPALAVVFPTAKGTASIMLDVGANVDSKPHHLEQWAVMGDIYFRSIFGEESPRIGLLSIGEEESKGNELTRRAHQLFKLLPLNFVGNVEGRDLYNGNVDVIVCDGFIGNVALKVSEGLAEMVRHTLKESLSATLARQVGFLLAHRAFDDFKKRLDYSEYGGAPLLGIKGVCMVSHGSSNAHAIKNAIRVAAEFASLHINAKIERGLAAPRRHHPAAASAARATEVATAPAGLSDWLHKFFQ